MSEIVYFKQIEVGPMQNFCYLVGDKKKGDCVLIDPAWEVDRVLRIAEADDMKVTAGLCTHAHYDHVNGSDDLIAATGGPVYINKHDAPYVREVKSDLKKVDSEFKLKIGDVEITFLHTPGHTPGSQCFLVDNHLISGDTLFINGCGRCDLPGGNAEKLYESLQRLKKLDKSVMLMPGHDYAQVPSASLEQVANMNVYWQEESKEDFLHHRMG